MSLRAAWCTSAGLGVGCGERVDARRGSLVDRASSERAEEVRDEMSELDREGV